MNLYEAWKYVRMSFLQTMSEHSQTQTVLQEWSLKPNCKSIRCLLVILVIIKIYSLSFVSIKPKQSNHAGQLHRACSQSNEQFKTQSTCTLLTWSGGKCVWTNHNWLCFWLDEKLVQVFLGQSCIRAIPRPITFQHSNQIPLCGQKP